MKKEKIPSLDIFRCLGILAVISIHVTSEPIMHLPVYTQGYFLYYAVNRGSSFAVPAFLFLSGFVLFYNYEGSWSKETCKSFFYKRLSFTVIPYILWSFFYYVGVQLIMDNNIFTQMDVFLVQLVTGKNYAHLYYVVIMIQFYLLFPLFMVLIERFSFLRRKLLLFALVFQGAFFLLNRWYFHIQATGSLAFTYILFYLLGAYLGLNYTACKKWLTKRAIIWAMAWLGLGILYLAKGWWDIQHPGFGQPWMAYANFVLYYTYVAVSCVGLFLLSHFLQHRGGKYLSLPTRWGQASFLIYLAHPAVLLLWRHYIVTRDTLLGYFFTTVLGGIAALLLSWAGYHIMSKYKPAWILIGKVNAEGSPVKKDSPLTYS